MEEDARQWLACVSGTTTVRPLSGDALRAAFSYFDKDGSGQITLIQVRWMPSLARTGENAAL